MIFSSAFIVVLMPIPLLILIELWPMSMPYLPLIVNNDGNMYDEDIDIKLFIEHGCTAKVVDIPEPGFLFIEEKIFQNVT